MRLLFAKTGLMVASAALLLGSSSTGSSAETAEKSAKPLVIAHRGGTKWAPENTLAAFKKSVETQCDGIELDIHRCKSGELVVIHDDDLGRTTNGSGFIKDTSYQDLAKLSAGAWFSPEFAGERIPLLSDVFKLVDGKLVINIEIKNLPVGYPGIEDDLIKALKDYKYPDKIVISSFDHDVLRRLHDKAPEYRLAFLGDSYPADLGKYAQSVGARDWNPYFGSLRPDIVQAAHENKLQVNTWTVNEPNQWKAALNMGVDSIITDDPKGLISFLTQLSSSGRESK